MEYIIQFEKECRSVLIAPQGRTPSRFRPELTPNVGNALREALAAWQTEHERFQEEDSAVVVLPNPMICMDQVTIPNIGKKAMNDALNTSINKLYKNRAARKVVSQQLFGDKRSARYRLVSAPREAAEGVRAALAETGLKPGYLTFHADALAAALVSEQPQRKDETFLLADVGELQTELIFFAGKTVKGWTSVPICARHLQDAKAPNESAIFRDRAAEALVREARQRALLELEPRGAAEQSAATGVENGFALLDKWISLYRGDAARREKIARSADTVVLLPGQLLGAAERWIKAHSDCGWRLAETDAILSKISAELLRQSAAADLM